MAIGKRIKYYREKLGWTLEEMSSKCGVEIGTISAIENRDSDRSKYFGAIAKAFGLTIEQLSDIETDWMSTPSDSDSGESINQQPDVLTPRQQALLGLFEGLTDSQKDALIRELQEKKQQNDELLMELLKRKQN